MKLRIRRIGVINCGRPASNGDWEGIVRQVHKAIKDWIADRMTNNEVVIVFIGPKTAGRKWIKYEIRRGWRDGKGLLGIHAHHLLNEQGKLSPKGRNPFQDFNVGGRNLSQLVKTYDPPSSSGTSVYAYIQENLGDWSAVCGKSFRRGTLISD